MSQAENHRGATPCALGVNFSSRGRGRGSFFLRGQTGRAVGQTSLK